MTRDIIARTSKGHIVTEDAILVRKACRAIRNRRDCQTEVRLAA